VFVFGGLDCLEVPPLGGAGTFPQVWGVSLPGRSSGLMVFATEVSQVGGPPGFEWWDGLDTGVCSLRSATNRFRDSDIHSSSFRGAGHDGAAGTLKSLMICSRVSQSVSAHHGSGGFRFLEGVARVIVIGTWSDPVEGRDASQLFTRGRRRGFAKARSITEGRAVSTRGNLVYSPGGLRSAKPNCAALSN